MEYRALVRYLRISPRKLRYMADLVRGQFAEDALAILKKQPNRGARMVEQAIKSAMGNAVDRRANATDDLRVVEICVDGAPMFKRFRPKARGNASTIKKRMSHLRVTLG